jgi:hypothetical protein
MCDNLSIEEELIFYKNKVQELIQEINTLKDHLKKYTSPDRRKKFYQEHKEELLNKNKEYQEKITPDKRAEYNKKAYLKRKEKIEKLINLEKQINNL